MGVGRIRLVLLGAAVAVTVAAGGCGGSSSPTGYKTAAEAAAYVRAFEKRYCHFDVHNIQCRDRATSWSCTFDDGSVFGGMSVQKHPPAGPQRITVAC